MNRSETVRLYGLVCLASLMFGISYVVSKGALSRIEPMQLMTYRMAVALCTMLAAMALGLIRVDFRKKPLRYLAVIGLAQPVAYSFCETWGLKHSSVSESVIIIAMIPIVATILSGRVGGEKNSRREYGFILLSFLGVVLATVFSGEFSISGKMVGYAFLLGAVVSGAVYTVLTNRLGGTFTPTEVTFGMTVMGFAVFHAFYFASGYDIKDYVLAFGRPGTLCAILYLGVCCSVLCYLIMNYVLSKLSVPKATALSLNLMTLTGIVAGVLFQGDKLGAATVCGIVLIAVGVVGVNRKGKEEACAEANEEI